MKYISTRGDKSTKFTFEKAITSGYAPDGGLFVPSELPPKVSSDQLTTWSQLGYPALAAECLRLFISDEEIPFEDLKEICRISFEKDNGTDDTGGFIDPENAVIVRSLPQGMKKGDCDDPLKTKPVFISELFHGPTFCFKDLGMKFVVNVLSYFCTKNKQKMTLIVSTTGDTGPAAVQSVNDLPNNDYLSILVHYPQGQISALQRKQLTTITSDKVKVVAFEGGGDDMDTPIKNMMTGKSTYKKEIFDKVKLCGVNSYNIGRPLMQMVHYVWTYLRVVEKIGVAPGAPDTKVDIVMPTGAMGNIAGGFIAKNMGVPLGFLCSGVNINDITHRVMQTGKFYKSNAMEKTLSDAINVQVPYNFERLLYYLSDGDTVLVKKWMKIMDSTNQLDLDQPWLDKLKSHFKSARITDGEMCHVMKQMKETFDYLVDPHTSVAIGAAVKLGYDIFGSQDDLLLPNNSASHSKNPMAILATASPCKFEESVTEAIGKNGWAQYYESDDFPKRARALMEKDEVSPIVYPWDKDKEFLEVQAEWECLALDIISKYFS